MRLEVRRVLSTSCFLIACSIPSVTSAEDHQSSNDSLPRLDVAAGFTMETPADVNLPPLCGNLALPCGTPRTFPDFGLATSGALYLRRGLALAGEASVFDNVWYSSLTKEGKEHNHVRSLLGGGRVKLVPQAVGGRQ